MQGSPRDDLRTATSPAAESPTSAGAAIVSSEAPYIGRPGKVRLIGRADELEQLIRFVDQLGHADGGFLVMNGEAGIGKSRLLEEAQSYAARQGVTCLGAVCEEQDRSIPYAPWVELLNDFVERYPREFVHRAVSPNLPALRKLDPRIDDRIWLYNPDAPGPREWDQRSFVRAIARFFLDLSAEGPLLLAIDDLALTDAASLQLLVQLARDEGGRYLGILATARDSQLEESPTVQRALFDLGKERRVARLAVDHLNPTAVGQLIRQTLGGDSVVQSLVDRIYERSGGNPFFVQEMVRSLRDSGSIRPSPHGWDGASGRRLELPSSVRSTIRLRVGSLDADCRTLLSTAALIGLEFPARLLAAVSEFDDGRLEAALQRAVKARLIQEPAAGSHGLAYSFSHPLIQEVLTADIAPVSAQRLHLRIAQAMEAAPGAGSASPAEALSFHYEHGGDVARGIEFAVLAGERSAALFARAEAAAHYRTALRLLPEHPDPARAASVKSKLAEQLALLGDAPAAAGLFEEAAGELEAVGNLIAAGDSLRRAAACDDKPSPHSFALLDRAGALLKSGPPTPALVDWHLLHALKVDNTGRLLESEPEVREALALAERLGDPARIAYALLVLSERISTEGSREVGETIERARRMIREHQLVELQSESLICYCIYLYHCRSEVRRALEVATEGADWAKKVGDREGEMFWRGVAIPWAHMRTGELDRASEGLEEFGKYRARTGRPEQAQHLAFTGAIAVLRGNFDEGNRLLLEGLAHTEETYFWSEVFFMREYLARRHLFLGEPEQAVAQLVQARDLLRAQGPPAVHTLHLIETLAILVRAYLATPTPQRAITVLEEMKDIGLRFECESSLAFVRRAEGDCLVHAGKAVDAIPLFRAAAQGWEGVGWRYEHACTLFSLGSALQADGQPEQSRLEFERALHLFDRIGARPDAERTLANLNALAG